MRVAIMLRVDAHVPSQLNGETDRQFVVRAKKEAECLIRSALASDNRLKVVTLGTSRQVPS